MEVGTALEPYQHTSEKSKIGGDTSAGAIDDGPLDIPTPPAVGQATEEGAVFRADVGVVKLQKIDKGHLRKGIVDQKWYIRVSMGLCPESGQRSAPKLL
jgi:hypothetical protein